MTDTRRKCGFTPLENPREFNRKNISNKNKGCGQSCAQAVKVSNSLTGFTFIEIAAVTVIISLIAFSMIGFTVYLITAKREKLNQGCRNIKSWIAKFQNECVLNKRNCIVQYDLNNHKVEAKYVQYTGEDLLYQEENMVPFDLPEDVKIVSVSLDPYRTYYNQKVAVSIRKDGWVTPHLVQLGVEMDETEMRIYTLEVMPLTGAVNVYTEEIGWEDLE